MKRTHYAIITGQALSYGLIMTFLFADSVYNLTGALRQDNARMSLNTAYIAACLVGIVGVTNIWLSWYYICKSNSVRDMLVICAWTHRVKTKEGWIPLEQFFTQQLGYAVSHGLSEAKLVELRQEVDRGWHRVNTIPASKDKADAAEEQLEIEEEEENLRPLGMAPRQDSDSSELGRPRSSPPSQAQKATEGRYARN